MCHSPEESEATLQKTKEVQKKAEEKYKVLENKMKNKEAEREKELKAAQKKLNEAKSKADAYNKKLKERQQVDFICSVSHSSSQASTAQYLSSILHFPTVLYQGTLQNL